MIHAMDRGESTDKSSAPKLAKLVDDYQMAQKPPGRSARTTSQT